MELQTSSPINVAKLKGQNKKLYDHLSSGKTITMKQAPSLGIGYLNSRISDLRNKNGIPIYDRTIEDNEVHMKEYSLSPFQNQ